MYVIKKDGTIVPYDEQKIINACDKSAHRALVKLGSDEYSDICNGVLEEIENRDYVNEEDGEVYVPVDDLHCIVENVLSNVNSAVGDAYRQYRNYKIDFCSMLDNVYKKAQEISYIGDVSNANADSTLISTQRSLIYGQLNKELYQKFFLTRVENQAVNDGYIYIHDMKDRRDTMNCCLSDIPAIMTGGFEMGNIWYNEPKSLDVAFDVIGDITLSMASQQYGGFTLPEVDKILESYAELTYQSSLARYRDMGLDEERAIIEAEKDVRKEFRQGFQGWEYKFNTVASSRGDYPFIAISFGLSTTKWGSMASEMALETRKNGQGKKGFKRPVLFPKLTFLYDKNLHGDGGDKYPLGWLFNKAIECSSKTMYPDYLSLTGEGYIPSIYKKYGKVISLMG